MNIKILIIIIIAVIVISAYAAVVSPSILYSIFHNPGSKYDIPKTWTDEKIIQDSDVIVMGEFVGYKDGQFVVGGHSYLIIKGDTKGQTVKVNSAFAKIHSSVDNAMIPQEGQTYIWFLTNGKEDKYEYASSMEKSLVDTQYYVAVLDFIAKPTIVSKIENKKGMVNLFDPMLPKGTGGLLDYHELVKTVSKPLFAKMFAEKHIPVNEEDIFLMIGPWISMYTDYSSACGYAISDNAQVYWLESELKQDILTKAVITDENPMPCKPNFGSCFCDAQYHLAKNTVVKLTYFDESQEAFVGELLQSHLAEEKVVNVPKKFVVGNHNLEMLSSDITFCGAFVREVEKDSDKPVNKDFITQRYLEGVIKNGQVVDFSLLQNTKLCAINDDAKTYPFEYAGDD